MAKKKFTIECEMEERWIDDFCSFLEYLEWCGRVGHSSAVGFGADGDGDFRPTFDISIKFRRKSGYSAKKMTLPNIERFFDAD